MLGQMSLSLLAAKHLKREREILVNCKMQHMMKKKEKSRKETNWHLVGMLKLCMKALMCMIQSKTDCPLLKSCQLRIWIRHNSL